MYKIYEKSIRSAFAGDGVESVVADEKGNILAHVRNWNNPAVVESPVWRPSLIGQNVDKLTSEWRPLTGFDLENAQWWALDVLAYR